MVVYKTKSKKISGTSYSEVYKQAQVLFKQIQKRTKRRPYVRSAYFQKEKIFLDFFWEHLRQKSPRDRFIRLKLFAAALDVLRDSCQEPVSQENPHVSGEILHRFAGITKEGEIFYVQVKQKKRSGQKYFMSCFPEK
ncbi:MAG: hypothetical protein V1664_04490 [Candidatus Uhrbacteria bacterium]